MLSEVLNFFWPSGDGYQRSLNLNFTLHTVIVVIEFVIELARKRALT